jgi:HSP20 family protein
LAAKAAEELQEAKMAQTAIRFPVRNELKSEVSPPTHGWYPFANLRREIDRLFEDFDTGFWHTPFRRPMYDTVPSGRSDAFGRNDTWANLPVDVIEKDGEYEIVCELPGIDEKDVEVTFSNGMLMIRGFKKQPKEEVRKDYYYFSERRYGSFERWFAVPEWVDFDKISAVFDKGVLTVMLPKSLAAKKQEKKIVIKAAA